MAARARGPAGVPAADVGGREVVAEDRRAEEREEALGRHGEAVGEGRASARALGVGEELEGGEQLGGGEEGGPEQGGGPQEHDAESGAAGGGGVVDAARGQGDAGEEAELGDAGEDGSDELRKELVREVRHDIGALAAPEKIHFTSALPKTRSGKIMRRILRKIAEGDTSSLGDISTLADPSVVERLIATRQG